MIPHFLNSIPLIMCLISDITHDEGANLVEIIINYNFFNLSGQR